jgi:hypothetical protein
MSSNLPAAVLEAGALLQDPLAMQDAEHRRLIIEWGRRQIAQEYPEDPIRAPLNVVRRKLALLEWERVIRTNGRELRSVVAGAAVRELEFQLQRRQEQLRAQDAERQRQEATRFDAELRIRETTQLADREHERQRDLLRLEHKLGQKAEDAASDRRIQEGIAAADQAIRQRLIEAVIETAGTNSAEETIRATRLVNEEITRIRRDPDLTPDEQHLHIKA